MSAIASRLIETFHALVTDPGTAFRDELTSLAAAAGADAVLHAAQAQAMVAETIAKVRQELQAAEAELGNARDDLQNAVSALEATVSNAQAALDKARSDGEAAVRDAERRAEQLRAAANAATLLDPQIAAMEAEAGAIVDAATMASQQAIDRAETAMTEAQASLVAQRQALEAGIAELEATVAQHTAAVQQAIAETEAKVAEAIQRLAADAQQVAGNAAAFPDRAKALAEDSRRKLTDIPVPNASLLGLITQALIYLKQTFFGDVPNLQVVTFTKEAGAQPGIGLTWVDDPRKLLVAYAPDRPGPRGSIVLQAEGVATNDEIPIGTGPVRITVSGVGAQETIISLESGAAPNGEANITVSATFDTVARSWNGEVGRVTSGTPRIEMRVRSNAGTWSHQIAAGVTGTAWEITLGTLLGDLGTLVPIPTLGETRSFTLTLEDGVFGYTEEVA